MADKQYKFISHLSGSLEVHNKGTSRFDIWWRLAPSYMVIFSFCIHMTEGVRDLSGASFMALIPFMRALPSWPNHIPKTPSPSAITLGFGISSYEFEGDACIVYCKQPLRSERFQGLNSIMDRHRGAHLGPVCHLFPPLCIQFFPQLMAGLKNNSLSPPLDAYLFTPELLTAQTPELSTAQCPLGCTHNATHLSNILKGPTCPPVPGIFQFPHLELCFFSSPYNCIMNLLSHITCSASASLTRLNWYNGFLMSNIIIRISLFSSFIN